MSFKKAIGKIHLWLGLASGLIVFIIAITGCLFVFQKEISEVVWKKTFFIEPKQTTVLPLSTLQAKAQAALGDQPVKYVTTYKAPDRAWEFMAYKTNDTALTYFGVAEYYRSVFIDPYDGHITGILDYKYNFFNIVKYIHWSLLLNTKYGQPIVGYSTLVFVLLLISGFILWWPKRWNKHTKEQAFTIKWKARFKRLNYDLHNVLGFYSLIISLVIALTGMVWALNWFQTTVYVIASRSITPPVHIEVKSNTPVIPTTQNPYDIAYAAAVKRLPGTSVWNIEPVNGKDATIDITGYADADVYYKYDELKFDQYTGKFLHKKNYKEANAGERLIYMNYDIHVGAIGGIPGKIIAFLAALIAASLPVTGFIIWLGKRRKKPATTIH
ncbi:PepSY-associated TM helix domain-containing protein [Ferruginibacter albus]|uniref:PepSY-associated TM helix domain-containing protein n=1 Tax=Ferruginibacter albus TaxID=2875540 RepID=UPI001CC4D01D|nr:PepSY-associated TM helix domain-containing protein [Ferruginibacter albus]UAY52488.1 PepSY domain-containing protein [Ferruginibacter albus]